MPSLLNFLPNAVGQGVAQIVYAEIATPAPASFEDPLFVVLPEWSVEFPVEITDWPAVHGLTLPLPGDAALLVKDSRGFERCVWWDGQMTFATQSSQTYYLTPTASDVAGDHAMTGIPYSPQTGTSSSGIITGQVIQEWVTPVGLPGLTFFPAGQFECHVHGLQTAGNQTVQFYAEFWEETSAGAPVAMIGATQVSKPLTTAEIEYRLFFSLDDTYSLAATTSRVAVRLKVLVGGAGGANVLVYVGGSADSHAAFPASTTNSDPLHLPGDLIASAASTRPGSLLCDGTGYSTTLYVQLFAAIGFVYGGASTTFHVPDLRGRVPLGAGTGTAAGATAHSLGSQPTSGVGGEETHTLSIAEMPAHGHPISLNEDFTGTGDGRSANFGYHYAGAPANTVPIGSTGDGGPHNILQPVSVVNWFIKT